MTVLPGVLGALRCRAYRHFTIGNVPSLLGQWAQRTALAWLMWRMTHSGTWIGALAFVELAPMALLSPLTGVLADRWRYLRVMRAVQLLLAGQALALFALARWGDGALTPGLMLVLVGLGGIVMAVDNPFRLSLVPTLVPRPRLADALALNSMLFNLARFAGPMLAAALLASGGAALAFIANALAALLFCAALHLLREPPLARPPTSEPLGRMFRDGLRYAFSHPGLRLMMGISVAAALLARSVPEILPGYAALFGHEAELFARMSAVVGAGAMLGGILVARGRSPRRLALMALTAAGALACIVILLALAPGRVPALALLFLLGTALVVSAVSNLSVIQMTADPSRRGRVLSLHTMIFRGGPAAGALAIGGLSDLVGLRLVLAFSGGLCLILALWCASRRQPGLASLLDEP